MEERKVKSRHSGKMKASGQKVIDVTEWKGK